MKQCNLHAYSFLLEVCFTFGLNLGVMDHSVFQGHNCVDHKPWSGRQVDGVQDRQHAVVIWWPARIILRSVPVSTAHPFFIICLFTSLSIFRLQRQVLGVMCACSNNIFICWSVKTFSPSTLLGTCGSWLVVSIFEYLNFRWCLSSPLKMKTSKVKHPATR